MPAKKNEAKDRVQTLLKERGYACQEGEKAFDLIERYMLESGLAMGISEATHKQQDETITGLKDQILKLQTEVAHASNESAPAEPATGHLVELLQESAAGFSDGMHYRSYQHRVKIAVESVQGVQIAE